VADPVVEQSEHRLPIGGNALDEGKEVRGADEVHPGGVELGGEGEAGERSVAAVGAAHDGDSLGIGNPLLNEPADAVGEVVLHLAAPLLVARVQVGLAVAGRAPKVDLEHGKAAVREPLRPGVEAPLVPPPRAAVGLPLRGQGEVALELEPVAGEKAHRSLFRQAIPG